MIYNIKKYLLIFSGSIFLALGIIGIFIPVLPTTPFLLLSSFCYLRSSRRLYDWLIHHKVFGAYIYNYLTYRAVPKSTKISALILLWLSLGMSMLFISGIYIRILLIIVGTGVTIHLITLKTLPADKLKSAELNKNRQ